MNQLDRVILTHLHSDHTIGLADLWLTPAVTGRQEPLKVWGPPGTADLCDGLRQAYAGDIEVRTGGREPAIRDAYGLEVTEIGPVEIAPGITAFSVDHGDWEHAFGLHFSLGRATIVHSGDTTYCPAVADHATGADLLIHEAYCAAGLAKRSAEWQNYHSSYHTSGPELARLCDLAQPKQTALIHVLEFGESEGSALAEVKDGWGGNAIQPRDLDSISLPSAVK